MTAAFDAPTRFYAVWVSNSGRKSLRWSEPYATPAEARGRAHQEVDHGHGTFAFVVRVTPEGKHVLMSSTCPGTARKIIEHYLELTQNLTK